MTKPTIEYLQDCFRLLPGGVLQWKARPVWHFKTAAAWLRVNVQRTGTIAGCVGKDGYVVVRVDNLLLPAHVVVFALKHGRYPVGEIDHWDRNRTNNEPSNLLDATRPQNMWNMAAHRDNRCGTKGVIEQAGRFYARIYRHGISEPLGGYATAAEAGEAYEVASIILDNWE